MGLRIISHWIRGCILTLQSVGEVSDCGQVSLGIRSCLHLHLQVHQLGLRAPHDGGLQIESVGQLNEPVYGCYRVCHFRLMMDCLQPLEPHSFW